MSAETAMSALGRMPLAIACALFACGTAHAEVTRIDITRRADVGTSGYEKIIARIHFAVDPKVPRNRVVVDLDKAPTNAAGLVEFSSDLYILRPKVTPGNGAALVDPTRPAKPISAIAS